MSPEKSPQHLFNEALERNDPVERARFLDEVCGADTTLRDRVEKLLRAHGEAGGFFSQPSKVSLSVQASVTKTLPLTEKPGDRIGRYKLFQQIGEGGCGVVYMAEQEEPVRRRVALKVIKLGMDTKQVIARFEAERQALAMMDHPNIARVLDAGTTDSGRPFFVMELVRGTKITEFCDERELSTQERLDLFLKVCSAIQHAHQKGVIHRDVKPSNILVTVVDGVAVPKVIDFGIAKATNNQPLTDKTLFTAFEQFIGTPAYMSPEQAELSGVDIDTRSDIYSLGAVLYELLTGGPPFDQKRLLAAGLDAMRRTIREEEPPRPSNRLSTMAAEALTITAHHRHTEPPKLIHSVRGDLDWIAMKCLEKDRARRYETANALAADIRRHLDCEPVVARPPSRWYEFQKTVRRHKFGFAAAGAVIVALAIGLAISTWQFVQKNRAYQRALAAEQEQSRQRQIAETKDKQSQQVARFLEDMLSGITPDVAMGRDTSILREIFNNTTKRVGDEFQTQPEVQAALLNIIGDVYSRIGDYAQAEATKREALSLWRSTLGNECPGAADSLLSLGLDFFVEGKWSEMETVDREALAIRIKLFGSEDGRVAECLAGLGLALNNQGKLAEAEDVQRKALAMRHRLFGEDHPDVAYSMNGLGNVLSSEGKLSDAEALYRKALEMRKSFLGTGSQLALSTRRNLARVLAGQGKLPEAEALLREAVDLMIQREGKEHPDTVKGQLELVSILERQNKTIEARDLGREVVERCRKQEERGQGNAGVSLGVMNELAWLLATCPDPALRDGHYAVIYAEKAVAATNRKNTMYLDTLAAAYAEAGDFARAVSVQKEVVALNQNQVLKDEFELRLKLYESNLPYHKP